MNFRPGVAEDIPALDALALLAKAHWGYSTAQLDEWRESLNTAPASLAARPVCVCVQDDGSLIGFIQLAQDCSPWEIWGMWVHPRHMGQGIGRRLLAWAERQALQAGQPIIAIDADPNAEAFYLACGATRVGEVAAPIDGEPARVRPQLRLSPSAA